MQTETETTQNIDKAVTNRMQLVVLLHVQKYQDEADILHIGCKIPFCYLARAVWRHMVRCKLKIACPDFKCRSSHQILAHWDSCRLNKSSCTICDPLKKGKYMRKRYTVPDCVAARASIDHFKNCTSVDCKRCDNIVDFRRKALKSRGFGARGPIRSALLNHSCRCQDRTCRNPMCIKMKRVLTHTNMCQSKTTQSMVCQEISTFCLSHTIVCTEKDCILRSKSQEK